jgi:tetratricopeptide (TPR) repeat protein
VATGDQRGVAYVREALAVLDPEANPLETANALSIEGRFHHLAGRHKKAKELLERAAALVAPAAESESVSTFAAPMISQVYAYNAGANQHYGLFEDANGWARRAVEFGTKHGVLFAQAIGFEFLGEDAVHMGEYKAGLAYAELEREIAEKLHSRERRCWVHFIAATCALHLGKHERSEREFVEGIALAESIGENRVALLMKCNFSVLQAQLGRLDEALQTASASFPQAEATVIPSGTEPWSVSTACAERRCSENLLLKSFPS